MASRAIGLLAVTALALEGAATAEAATSRPWDEFHCGKHERTLTYLFWPKGNTGRGTPATFPASSVFVQRGSGSIGPGIQRPDIRRDPVPTRAHLTLYRPGRAYRKSNWRFYVDATGAVATPKGGLTGSPCAEAPDPRPFPLPAVDRAGPNPVAIANRRRTTKPIALTCRFRTPYGYMNAGAYRVFPGEPEGAAAIVHDRSRVIMHTVLSDDRPRLDFDRSRCQRTRLPA
jgi:hypothetical protein